MSGARTFYTPRLCGGGTYFNDTIQRPNAPNAQIDMQVAQHRVMQIQSAQIAQAQATQMMMLGMVAGMSARPIQQPRQLNCTTSFALGTAYTNCQ